MEKVNPSVFFAHKSAEVSDKALIGEGTRIWNWVQVRENVRIGKNCVISKSVYIDSGVTIGDNVKIQNNVSVYDGVSIEDGVFIGPHVCFTNDKLPRAINPDGSLKSASDWDLSKTIVRTGASIGANSTIVTGIVIGRFAMVGAGSVVTKNVDDFTLVYGNPAKAYGKVDESGNIVERFICHKDKK